MVLGYDAKHQLLMRPGGNFRLSRALWTTTIREASKLRGGRTPFYAGLGVAALVAIAAFVVARRRRA